MSNKPITELVLYFSLKHLHLHTVVSQLSEP